MTRDLSLQETDKINRHDSLTRYLLNMSHRGYLRLEDITRDFYLQVVLKYIGNTSYYVTRKKHGPRHFISEQKTEEE